MKIGIITAMPEEFNAVAKSLGAAVSGRLGRYRSGRFRAAGHDVILVESGMGFGNAAAAAATLLRAEKFDLLISTGFCGGVAPELQAGDLVVAEKILTVSGRGSEELPAHFAPVGQSFVAAQAAEGKRIFRGTFASTATITSKSALAGILSGRYPCPVVEMESGAIVAIAAENSVPLLAIRAVSDCAAEELAFSLDEFCDADLRRIRPAKVLLTILRKPYIIPQLLRLSRSSRRAAESITSALYALFPTL